MIGKEFEELKNDQTLIEYLDEKDREKNKDVKVHEK